MTKRHDKFTQHLQYIKHLDSLMLFLFTHTLLHALVRLYANMHARTQALFYAHGPTQRQCASLILTEMNDIAFPCPPDFCLHH